MGHRESAEFVLIGAWAWGGWVWRREGRRKVAMGQVPGLVGCGGFQQRLLQPQGSRSHGLKGLTGARPGVQACIAVGTPALGWCGGAGQDATGAPPCCMSPRATWSLAH